MSSSIYKQRLMLRLLAKRSSLHSSGSQGFTLIELLVVIVILGVLGAVGYNAYIDQLVRANTNTAIVTATAGAKNCAALLLTGDGDSFAWGINTAQVTASPTVCTASGAFQVTAGAANAGSGQATINADGSVTPG